MANRFFENRNYALEKMPVTLYAVVACTGSNATQVLTRAKGITSIVQSGTGLWTVTLQDQYFLLLEADIAYLGAPGAADIYMTANNSNLAAKTLLLQNVGAGNTTPTSPSASQIAYLTLSFSNSNST